jgi:hypothetical protein
VRALGATPLAAAQRQRVVVVAVEVNAPEALVAHIASGGAPARRSAPSASGLWGGDDAAAVAAATAADRGMRHHTGVPGGLAMAAAAVRPNTRSVYAALAKAKDPNAHAAGTTGTHERPGGGHARAMRDHLGVHGGGAPLCAPPSAAVEGPIGVGEGRSGDEVVEADDDAQGLFRARLEAVRELTRAGRGRWTRKDAVRVLQTLGPREAREALELSAPAAAGLPFVRIYDDDAKAPRAP